MMAGADDRRVAADAEIRTSVLAWARSHFGEGTELVDLVTMPGNSGVSYGAELAIPDAADAAEAHPGSRVGLGSAEGPVATIRTVVLRLAPPGVRRKGNTDVLRQADLVRRLEPTSVPVARVLAADADSEFFGTDVIAQELLAGSTVGLRDDAWRGRDADAMTAVDAVVAALVDIHRVDAAALPDWQVQKTLADQFSVWRHLLEKSGHGELSERGLAVGRALEAAEPAHARIGLTHGDFQLGNVLIGDDLAVTGVVDWELASIGPVGCDVGWLTLFLDPSLWAPEWAEEFTATIPQGYVAERYSVHAGEPIPDADWYLAYACFKYGAIVCFNHYLHTTGKRADPLYERLIDSAPHLFGAAERLLGGGSAG